ncbi:MAG: hypothetical protein ACP5OV_04375 [Acidimicrobiales bacterium]
MDAALSLDRTWRRWRVRGGDGEAFVQSQASQDLGRLAPHVALWSGFLAPTGELVAAVRLERLGDELDLRVPALLADSLRRRLERFRLRRDVDLVDEGEVADPLGDEATRVAAQWPGPAELARGLVPHAYGRRFVDQTVSFTKGCYPGQEMVARMEARGATAPWRLVWGRARALADLDAYLRGAGPEGPSGVTTAVALPDGTVSALGFAHRTLAETADGELTVAFVT